MSSEQRGIFDGENPPSQTFIFDPAIFDISLSVPVASNEITVFTHGNKDIEMFWHGNQPIPQRLE